jgi:hypothetical protein
MNPPTEKIESRIRKLLALAADKANEHEAALAAATAQELMIKYQIDQANFAVDASNPVQVEVIEQHDFDIKYGANVKRWKAYLASAIAPHFFCKIWFVPRAGIRIAGRKSDVESLKYLYEYLVRGTDPALRNCLG